jgi:hypothetical protein
MIPMRLILVAILCTAITHAYPYGAGSCNSVNPLGEGHLVGGVVTSGQVSAASLQLTIDGKVVDPKVTFSFPTGKDLNITLGSATGATFRGFLMRISTSANNDTTGFLKVGSDSTVQVLGLCTAIKIGGISHVARLKKSKVSGVLRVNKPIDNLKLEVTVVRNGETDWFKSDYILKAATSSPTICFPGQSKVSVKDSRGMVAMQDLKLGDHVLVAQNKYEPIYSFGHFDPHVSAQYLQLRTPSTELDISKDHMVFVDNTGAIPASAVKIGDKVVMASGSVEAVVDIKSVVRKGAFAPFTPSGTVVVNGVKASSFVSLQESSSVLVIGGVPTGLSYQWLAHTFELPHRVWCSYAGDCTTETYVEGVSVWVSSGHKFALWFLNAKSDMWMAFVSVPVLAFFAVLGLAGMILSYPVVALVLAVLGASFRFKNKCV